MVRNISRLQKANRARDIVQTYPPLAGPPVNTANTAGKGRTPPPPGHWSARAPDEIVVPDQRSRAPHAEPSEVRDNRTSQEETKALCPIEFAWMARSPSSPVRPASSELRPCGFWPSAARASLPSTERRRTCKPRSRTCRL